MAHDLRYFLHSTGLEVPNVKVAAVAGEEDFVALGREEEGCLEGRGANVEVCQERVWIGWVGRDAEEGEEA